MDIQGVLKYLPHRYPFLLLDRVVSLEPGKSIQALKNVSINEPFFQGHFPHHPVMPGVLIIEAMAQAAATDGWARRLTCQGPTLYSRRPAHESQMAPLRPLDSASATAAPVRASAGAMPVVTSAPASWSKL